MKKEEEEEEEEEAVLTCESNLKQGGEEGTKLVLGA